MARIRSIKPEVWTDPEVVSCSPLARLLWIGSWNHADDYGVLKDDPARLKLQVLPADDCDPRVLVDELVNRGLLLRRVTPDGTRVLVIRTFCVHQKIDTRAAGRWGHPDTFTAESRPIPPDPARSQPIPTDPAGSPPVANDPDHTTGQEGEGKENEYVTSEPEPPALKLVPDTVTPSAPLFAVESDQAQGVPGRSGGTISQEPQLSAAEESAQRFEEQFWLNYPRRHGRRVGKPKALAKWKKLNRTDQEAALRGVKNYAAHCERTDTWPKDAERWLRDRLWEEWQDPPTSAARRGRPPVDPEMEFDALTSTPEELGLKVVNGQWVELGRQGAGAESA